MIVTTAMEVVFLNLHIGKEKMNLLVDKEALLK